MAKINISKGILYMLIASFIFAWMGVFVKIVSDDINSIEVVFFRNVFGTLFLVVSLIRKPAEKKGKALFALMFRGFVGVASLYALFYNMANIGLGKAITYLMTSPLFVALFSWLFLKEKISVTGWFMILIGFIGIIFVFQPSTFDPKTDFLGLFNGVGAAAAYTAVRKLRNDYDHRIIVLSFMGWGVILPLFSFIFYYLYRPTSIDFLVAPFIWPDWWSLLNLFLVGLTSTAAQIFMTKAYAEEKAGIISALGYFNVPFAILLGLLFGDGLPDILAIFGTILIISSGTVLSLQRNT